MYYNNVIELYTKLFQKKNNYTILNYFADGLDMKPITIGNPAWIGSEIAVKALNNPSVFIQTFRVKKSCLMNAKKIRRRNDRA